jgi:ribonucleoside-diphosphate reductase alpha chain
MNLGRYINNAWEKDAHFDFARFTQDTRTAVRFLDNIISLEKSPLEFQQWANDNGRRLGLGFMGLADVFMKMSCKFDSDHALELAHQISNMFMIATYDASCELAKEKGPFPAFEVDRHMRSDFIKRLPEQIQEKIQKTGIRGVGNQAIAPTGSIAIIARSAGAMEPAFKIHHIRKTCKGIERI